VVSTNDKQRFSMILASSLKDTSNDTSIAAEPVQDLENTALQYTPESEDPEDYLIRANQGHSMKVDTEGLLTPITEEAGNVPDVCVHGTDEPAWKLILKSGGLRRMGRTHIHMASGLPAGFKTMASDATEGDREAPPVISGMRKSSTILIYIDIRAALAAGVKFFVSENGVILTEGDEKGFLSHEFFKRVESRKENGRVLMENGALPEGTVVNVEEWEKEVGDVGGRGKRGGRGGRGRGGRGGKTSVNDDSGDLMAGI
jgi:2'-phosphotransferase